MNIQQLETFLWVARLHSFSQAALKIHISQSTASMRVAELEKSLGVQLLDRRQHSIRLTPKGRDLLRYAEEIVHLMSEVRQFIGNAEVISGTLRIGAAELVALTWLPDLVKAISFRYPLIDLELCVGLGSKMIEEVSEGKLDVALTPVGSLPIDGIQCKTLGSVHFSLLAGSGLRMPGPPLTPRALSDLPIITHGPASVLHRVVSDWFDAGGIRLRRFVTSSSMEAAARLAEKGLGVTYLPLKYYDEWIVSGRLKTVSTQPQFFPVPFKALYSSGRAEPILDAIVPIAMECSTFDD